MSTIKEKIENLWADSIDVKPEDYNFGERYEGEIWENPFEKTDEEMENEEFIPMMNYRYPLPDFEERKLSDSKIKKALNKAGAVTVVSDLDKEGYRGGSFLALTGGGMDLSWDIVKGYINLGYTPPSHFCRHLPKMAGKILSEENKEAIAGCRRSLDVHKGWLERGITELNEVEKYMMGETRRYKAMRK